MVERSGEAGLRASDSASGARHEPIVRAIRLLAGLVAVSALLPAVAPRATGAVNERVEPGVSFVMRFGGRDAARSRVCLVSDIEGASPRRLTRPGAYLGASVNPRGDRLAVIISIRGQSTLAVSRLDGSSRRAVASRASSPAWSPDGSKIAFLRGNAVFVADRDGGHVRRVTRPLGRLQRDESPGWLRATGRIYFVRSRVGPVQAELVSIKPDGTGWRTERLWAENVAGLWSPTLAMRAYLDDGQLIVTTADATSSWKIAGDRLSPAAEPSWSSDGAKLAFVQRVGSTAPASAEVFTANADGSALSRLTHDRVEAQSPSWARSRRTFGSCTP